VRHYIRTYGPYSTIPILLCLRYLYLFFCFFFNDTATTEIYTLSLHDALPIFFFNFVVNGCQQFVPLCLLKPCRSEEHTSELQSLTNLVCRLLLEKKNKESNTLSIPRLLCIITNMLSPVKLAWAPAIEIPSGAARPIAADPPPVSDLFFFN